MGVEFSRHGRRVSRFDHAVKDATADGRITASEAKRILGRAQVRGLDAHEREVLQRLSKDTFTSTAARHLFANALEGPPKPIVK